MSMLLTKRLARSLWRTKLRLFAVVLMVTIGVFAGIAFGAMQSQRPRCMMTSTKTMSRVSIYPMFGWRTMPVIGMPRLQRHCVKKFEASGPVLLLNWDQCEPRLRSNGQFFSTDADIGMIPAVWHGIDEGEVDKVWIPDHDCCSGRFLAAAADEIVIDQHAVEALQLKLGDTIRISAGAGFALNYNCRDGFHSNHLFFTIGDDIVPAQPGTFVTGYMTAEGLENLGNFSSGESNLLLIDVVGTPDSQSPEESGLNELKTSISTIVSETDDSAMSVF